MTKEANCEAKAEQHIAEVVECQTYTNFSLQLCAGGIFISKPILERLNLVSQVRLGAVRVR